MPERCECKLGEALDQANGCLPRAGGHRKGKYGPLAGLVPRLGAQALLQMEPKLIEMSMEAMNLDAVCKSASGLLAALLDSLWTELHASNPGDCNNLLAHPMPMGWVVPC